MASSTTGVAPNFSTLISAAELVQLQASGSPAVIFDCSFELSNADVGAQKYTEVHIAGAHYAHLDLHLSSKNPSRAASAGRHPLPLAQDFAHWLAGLGVQPGVQVVVYDRNGNNYCGRMWWMLDALGYTCAVLDGGLAAWQAAGGPTATGAPSTLGSTTTPPNSPENAENGDQTPKNHENTQFVQYPRYFAATQYIANNLANGRVTLIDARSGPRYRGEIEPLDPVAGHIPGALNRPFASNMDETGFFKTPAVLRQEFETLLAGRDPASVVHHCGSGVSAVPNLLAMRLAGLGATALYAGSWSEWCTTPGLPVARG